MSVFIPRCRTVSSPLQGAHLLILVQPHLVSVDGHVDLGLGSLQLQVATLLAVAARPETRPGEDQLILDSVLQCVGPLIPLCCRDKPGQLPTYLPTVYECICYNTVFPQAVHIDYIYI